MRVLLDTHAFLWFVLSDPGLSPTAAATIGDPDNDVLVSPASYWELAIKISIGKYALTTPFETFWREGIDGNAFEVLPIEVRHAGALTALTFHHRDPFDRMIVARAMVDGVAVVSGDAILGAYPIRRIW